MYIGQEFGKKFVLGRKKDLLGEGICFIFAVY
jgi:hypothetical protein